MTIKIGVHGANPSLYLLSRLGLLEPALEKLGETVEWVPVQGTRVAELLGTGAIDFSGTGSTPPIAGQAADHDIVYTAVSAPRPEHGALLVAADGPVRSAADLRGGTIVLAVGSWQTHFVAKALHRAGLAYGRDITAERPPAAPVSSGDTARRLRDGEIAGWVAQGAELSAALRDPAFRVLLKAREIITDRSVFFARRDLVENRPDVVATLTRALQEADNWAAAHIAEAARVHADDQGGTAEDWHRALADLPWRLEPVSDAFIAEQQEAADIFAEHGYIPRRVVVADARVASIEPTVAEALAGAGTALTTSAAAGIEVPALPDRAIPS
ncbi:ABC transporter substrate-binding protein [Yinghuangia sp. ASG 101]|uniref:ABC transporter substrate-binding protein n=1 Tax=Yinghuangia sp. ASG 101 TaxID=2896848 RepID=UPI001E628707|nr:ABC transporter substrate-binding protein [Yinghuangia sp. ASG 101]UGQ12103.1 ABC transporter substrate-binding protein [Yinghuangia sp. ASG 101]